MTNRIMDNCKQHQQQTRFKSLMELNGAMMRIDDTINIIERSLES